MSDTKQAQALLAEIRHDTLDLLSKLQTLTGYLNWIDNEQSRDL